MLSCWRIILWREPFDITCTAPWNIGHTQRGDNILAIGKFSWNYVTRTSKRISGTIKHSCSEVEGNLDRDFGMSFIYFYTDSRTELMEKYNFVPHSSWWKEITYSNRNETEIRVHMHQWVRRCLLQHVFCKSLSIASKHLCLLNLKCQWIQLPLLSRKCILHYV
jgi:hypothetical protein